MHELINGQPARGSARALANRPNPERPPNLRDAAFQRQGGKFLIGASLLGFLLILLFNTLTVMRERNLFQRLQQAGVEADAQVVDRFNVGHGLERLTYRFSAPSQSTDVGKPEQR